MPPILHKTHPTVHQLHSVQACASPRIDAQGSLLVCAVLICIPAVTNDEVTGNVILDDL
jgi:hypothetical protein